MMSAIFILPDDTLWTGVPGNYTDPKAPGVLAEVRGLVDQGRFADATASAKGLFGGLSEVCCIQFCLFKYICLLAKYSTPIHLNYETDDIANDTYSGLYYFIDTLILVLKVYQPLGDLNIEFSTSDEVYDSYKRELDLHTATALVTYNVGGVQYTREHFCSNPDQVIVTRFSASTPGHVSCTLSLSSQLNHNITITNENEMIMEGICPGQRPALRENGGDNTTGIRFTAALGLQMGGSAAKVTVLNDQKLRLDSADWVVFVVAAASSFDGPLVNPADSKLDPTSLALSTLNNSRNFTFDQLKAAHLDDYQSLFNRVTLQLSRALNDSCTLVTRKDRPEQVAEDIRTSADRVKSFSSDEDPSLVELLFQYGRYLLISCSRPGTQVSNLQGIWSQDITPEWE